MASTTHTTRVARSRPSRHGAESARTAVSEIRVIAEVAALLVIIVLLIAIPVLSRHAKTSSSSETTKVLIQSGDTLWTFAQSNPQPGLSTAQAVENIAALNGLQTAQIPVGSAIEIPVSPQSVELACK